MILGITILLACQLAGEVLSRWLSLAVPGPVIGLALLVVGLALRRRFAPQGEAARMAGDAERVADGLLLNLAFLFVPAGVGVVDQLPLINAYGAPLLLALVGSTILTLAATVWVFVLVKRWLGPADEARP